jgi:hypothetical protein
MTDSYSPGTRRRAAERAQDEALRWDHHPRQRWAAHLLDPIHRTYQTLALALDPTQRR